MPYQYRIPYFDFLLGSYIVTHIPHHALHIFVIVSKKYHIHCFPKIPDTFQKYIFPLFTILPYLFPTLIFDHNTVIYSYRYHARLHRCVITQMLRLVNIQHTTKIPSNESDITIGSNNLVCYAIELITI